MVPGRDFLGTPVEALDAAASFSLTWAGVGVGRRVFVAGEPTSVRVNWPAGVFADFPSFSALWEEETTSYQESERGCIPLGC
jgi:hypothetical protein